MEGSPISMCEGGGNMFLHDPVQGWAGQDSSIIVRLQVAVGCVAVG